MNNRLPSFPQRGQGDGGILEAGPEADDKFAAQLRVSKFTRTLVNWFSLIKPYVDGRRMTKTASLIFPACPANSSVDVDMAFPGAVPDVAGTTVTIGLSSLTKNTVNNLFVAFISAPDVVTVRELCVDLFGIGGFTDTFTITILLT